ncbi:MAG: CapA family protein, partial [Bacteroidota bacterium]|nr:CapA family protein [Bacteroidota bacterium]
MLKNRSIVLILFLLFTSFTSYPTTNVPVLKICFTGDLLLDRGVRNVIEHRGADVLFKGTDSLFRQMDYVISNLECPVTSVASPLNKRFIFRAEPMWLPSLKKAGITHLCMANNHCNDQGRNGIIETYRNIRKFQMTPLGFCQNQNEGLSPVLIQRQGKTIALFNSALLPLENWMYLPDYPDIVMATADK